MKPFTTLAAAVFAMVAIAHLARLILGWEVMVAGTVIPMWASILGLVIAAVLAAMLWLEARR